MKTSLYEVRGKTKDKIKRCSEHMKLDEKQGNVIIVLPHW